MRSVLDEAEPLLIAVNPGWQGLNIGRTLRLDNIATAHSRNIHHIHLEVRETNKAIQLYRSAGFVQSNTRKGYYHGKDGEVFRVLLRSEEHTSELQSLMRISYAVLSLKKKK